MFSSTYHQIIARTDVQIIFLQIILSKYVKNVTILVLAVQHKMTKTHVLYAKLVYKESFRMIHASAESDTSMMVILQVAENVKLLT